jgi:murein DD-endopeptidase MepM/ murein hydrolase activator NlpD
MGADMARAASGLLDAARTKTAEFEDANTLEAYNKFRREVNDYHNDPEKGIYRAKFGKDASGVTDAADAWIDNKIFEHSQGLSRRAAENFGKMASEARERYYAANQDWEYKQFEAYRDAEADGTIQLELDAIANEWGDDAAVEGHKKLIYQALELKLRGLGNEARKAAVAEVEDRIAGTRFGFAAENMAASDAGAWLAEHKDDFSAAAYRKAELFLEEKDKKQRVAGAADAFYARFGTDERAAKAAIYTDETMPEDEHDLVWARYEAMTADEKRFQREAEDAMYTEWWDEIQGAQSYAGIVAEIQNANLTAAQEKKLLSMAKQAWSKQTEDDLGTYFYVYEQIQSPSGMIKNVRQLAAYADRLKPETLKTFGKMIMDGGFKSERLAGNVNDRVNLAFKRNKEPNKGTIDFYEKQQFTEIYLERLFALAEAKKAPLDDNDRMGIANSLLFEVKADEHPSKCLRYEILAAERAGFVWNDEYGDMVKMSPDGTYIKETWTAREERLSSGSDARPLTLEYWAGQGAGGRTSGLVGLLLPGGGSVSSAFGATESFRKSPHRGIDIKGRLGSPIAAPPGEWEVVSVITGRSRSEDTNDPGNQIVLAPADGGGDERVYLNHLDSAAVNVGDIVYGGNVIAGMGNTGYTVGDSGVHLDVKVKSGGQWVDPLVYFGLQQ